MPSFDHGKQDKAGDPGFYDKWLPADGSEELLKDLQQRKCKQFCGLGTQISCLLSVRGGTSAGMRNYCFIWQKKSFTYINYLWEANNFNIMLEKCLSEDCEGLVTCPGCSSAFHTKRWIRSSRY